MTPEQQMEGIRDAAKALGRLLVKLPAGASSEEAVDCLQLLVMQAEASLGVGIGKLADLELTSKEA